ncbi:cell division protein ZapA [Rurimicrobium arvi]|uniref:Cell division protein ZapA n=1 Tax=Rurimicrobium arvi TaxID=2049916 RepID=A0ABP8MGU4_9BACT
MQDEDLIPVNLWLSGRSYRIKVKRSEAENIRKSVKLADEKIFELKQKYSGRDDQDFLAMCLLMYASNSMDEPAPKAPVGVTDMIQQISDTIDNALSR